jgi:hypothetical protein
VSYVQMAQAAQIEELEARAQGQRCGARGFAEIRDINKGAEP